MRVLSLFDGIAGGRLAMERAELQCDEYIAVEIDAAARKTADYHYDITRPCDDVRNFHLARKVGKVDLMITGFPCQDFSVAGHRKNLAGEHASLYKEMLRWRDICKPNYFVLENVRPFNDIAPILNADIGVPFVLVNSMCYGAQHRERAYWTSDKFTPLTTPSDDAIEDVLHDDAENEKQYSYYPVVPNGAAVKTVGVTRYSAANLPDKRGLYMHLLNRGDKIRVKTDARVFDRSGKISALRTRNFHKVPVVHDSARQCRNLTIAELAAFQHVPVSHLAAPIIHGCITNPQAIAAIGNGFDIAVVSDILSQVVRGNNMVRDEPKLL